MKKTIKYVLLVVFLLAFLFSAYKLMAYAYRGYLENKAFKALRTEVIVSEKQPQPAEAEEYSDVEVTINVPKQENATVQDKFRNLYEENPDLVGWIKIDGTKIDYPVMFTPDEPEFYLRRGFDKSSAWSGTPFVGKNCTVDPIGDNVIVYGHNMKNGTMFSDLLKYKNETYRNKHRMIQFDTLYESGSYEILWAFEEDVSSDGTHFRFYDYCDLSNEESRNEFVDGCRSLCDYQENVNLTGEEQFLTLVTCDYDMHNGRFVVVAKKAG